MEGDGKSLAAEEVLCCDRLFLEAGDRREEQELEEAADRLRGLVAARGRWWQFATFATLRWLTLLLSSSLSACPTLLKSPFLQMPSLSLLPSFPTSGSDLLTASTSLMSSLSQHLLLTLILAYRQLSSLPLCASLLPRSLQTFPWETGSFL